MLTVLAASLAAVFLFGAAGVAHAQTSRVLVSNIGQTFQIASGYSIGGAQGFSTGTNADGYTLTSVELRLSANQVPTVTLHRGSPAGTKVADFTGPSSAAGRADFVDYTFTPTTTVTLDRNTDYWLVATGSAFGDLWAVAGSGEDATPAPGWSIRDRGQSYNPDPGSWQDHGADIANQIRVKGTIRQPPPPPTTGGGGGGGGTPSQPPPGAPRNLLLESGDGQVTLTWDAPEDDGGAAITDYEYRINGQGRWISTGSTDTTYTVTGLDNDTVYTFQLRSVNRNGRSQATDRIEATPRAPVALAFTHFTNGRLMTSEIVLVNVETRTIRPALYFYDQDGEPIDPESVVDVTGDLEITGDGALTVQTAMEPLGELTVATHGRGEPVSGSVRVVSDGTIGGILRFDIPGLGVAGVGASPPVNDALFPVRRQAGGINTGVALHNVGAEALGVSCYLMSGGVALEAVEIPLEANGQTARFIDQTFTATDTSDFSGSVRCSAPGRGRFTAITAEMDAAGRIFTTLPVVEVNRGRAEAATLDFAHFTNGTWITDLVFVNLETRQSGPPLTPFHTAIPPTRPVIYFYDTEGNPIAPASVVDVTGDLIVTEDGALTLQTDMEPLSVLTISTHGRGELVSGSVKVVSEGPLGGMLRFDHPDLGVAGVGTSTPVNDAIVPVRRQEGGITTGVALHNLESTPELVRCELMQAGVLLETASIPLDPNGQTSWLIDQAFPSSDTSDFSGSVRCDAVGEGLFTAVALELDAVNRIFTTLPVVAVLP